MRRFTLKEIAEITNGELVGSDVGIERIYIDSRRISYYEDSLFFAIAGKQNNGHDYLESLYAKGMRAFVVQLLPDENIFPVAGFVLVKDTIKAMQLLAAFIRMEYNGELLAITGSNGKTVVKEWIYQSLSAKISMVRSPLSYNSQVGVPLSVSLLEKKHDLAVMEAGISQAGEMNKLQKILKPDIGIFTNIGEAHQENFKSVTEKAREKASLFSDAEFIIFCSDNKVVKHSIERLGSKVKHLSWGESSDAKYFFIQRKYTDYTLIEIKSNEFKGKFKTGFTDKASLENLGHVLVYLIYKGYKHDFIQNALDELEVVGMRMEILKGMNNCTLINDSYNSDLASFTNAVEVLLSQNQHPGKTIILSDIYQSGKSDKELYQQVSELIREKGIDNFIGVGPRIKKHDFLFDPSSKFFPGTDELMEFLSGSILANEAILIKGSRKFYLERVSALLQEKAHRTILTINLTHLAENYRYYKSLLPRNTKVMAMVKAFSYGSGGYEIANILQYNNAEYLAVAFADEGVMLRKGGIELPIMVMNPEENDYPLITEYQLEPEIYNFRILDAFQRYVNHSGLPDFPVHIKVDTGMHRLGFNNNEAEKLKTKLRNSPLRVQSVFTHLAGADEERYDENTHNQIHDFNRFCDKLDTAVQKGFLRHVLNSAGIERFPQYAFDMVRLGIGLYGVSQHHQPHLKEVSSFKTRIAQIRKVKHGERIGYSFMGKVNRDSVIATLPAGYADGIPRSLGNGVGKFKIKGKLAPVIGNVCMDMTMVDITGINCEEGDEVIIFGEQHSVRELAKSAQTIPYEILTGVSQRVKRIYHQE